MPYNGEGFKIQIPSKWNQSKKIEYPGQVLRYDDNFDATRNVSVTVTSTDKKTITDYGELSPRKTKGYLGETASEGGFNANAVATINILETYGGREGGKNQLITATVHGGKLYICKATSRREELV